MPEPAETSAIDVRSVRKVFGTGPNAFLALDAVSVAIRPNEFFTLLGPSGCGKTSLLRLIAGFDYPTSGEILLYGEDIAALPPFRRPVNTVFQSYALFPHMTVAQNIGFGLEMLGRPRPEIDARVAEMLRLVRMEALADRRTSQISGGQQQRVALARALAPQPKVLLLDEPLSALDYKLRKEMQIELKRLQLETGITFIFVTHDQEEALAMSDRLAVMSAGRILQVGAPAEIYDHPAARFVAEFIGESNFISGRLVSVNGGEARLALPSGATLITAAPTGLAEGAAVSVMIRPEYAQLVPPGAAARLSGVVETIVYLGTDTQFHLRLEDGAIFTVRRQNLRGGAAPFAVGDRVGLTFEDCAVQVVRD